MIQGNEAEPNYSVTVRELRGYVDITDERVKGAVMVLYHKCHYLGYLRVMVVGLHALEWVF
jgi:hypothetical protein